MNHIFISYKSEEHEFTLKLAAALKNRGIRVWVDRLDGGIEVGDQWTQEIGTALKTCSALIAVLTPDYFKSRICQDELDFAYRENRPIFPLLLRPAKNTEMPYWLPGRQWIDFNDWYDDKIYHQNLEKLTQRIGSENESAVGDAPSNEIQYLNTLIAELESWRGVEEYIALRGQVDPVEEKVRPNPRAAKRIEAGLSLLVKAPKEESTDDAFREPAQREPIDNIHAARDKHPRFVLIGDPGAGKTTTIRRLALEEARARLEWLQNSHSSEKIPPIPLMLYLPRWGDEPTPVDFVANQWTLGGNVLAELKTGHIHLYLDGLNEMGAAGKDKASLLRDWLKKEDAPKHVIITCRQGDYGGDLDLKLPTVQVEPLQEDQIRHFAEKYLNDEAEKFLEQVFPKYTFEWKRDDEEARSLLNLAKNPYMLAALTLVYEEGGELPRNTGALFNGLVAALWERERLRGTPGWIPFEEMQLIFGRLAFEVIDEDQSLDIPLDYAYPKLGNPALLRLGISAGFITQIGEMIRFYHQLMLEYFAALELEKIGIGSRLQKPNSGRRQQIETKWEQVIIALCGISNTPDEVVGIIAPLAPYLAAECLTHGTKVTRDIKDKVIDIAQKYICGRMNVKRLRAVNALRQIGSPSAVPGLLKVLLDESDVLILRKASAEALGRISSPDAIVGLMQASLDKNQYLRAGSSKALRQLRLSNSFLVVGFIKILDNQDSSIRREAVKALGEIGTLDAVPGLLKALLDESHGVRVAAAEGLGKIGSPDAVPGLLKALADKDSDVRGAAAEALGEIGSPDAVPGLIECLQDFDIAKRSGRGFDLTGWSNYNDLMFIFDIALKALEKIGTSEALEAVRKWREQHGW